MTAGYYSVKDLCELLGKSCRSYRFTVYRLIREGKLRPSSLPGTREIFFEKGYIDKALKPREVVT